MVNNRECGADEGHMHKLIGCLVAKVGAGAHRAWRMHNDSRSGSVICAGSRVFVCEQLR